MSDFSWPFLRLHIGERAISIVLVRCWNRLGLCNDGLRERYSIAGLLVVACFALILRFLQPDLIGLVGAGARTGLLLLLALDENLISDCIPGPFQELAVSNGYILRNFAIIVVLRARNPLAGLGGLIDETGTHLPVRYAEWDFLEQHLIRRRLVELVPEGFRFVVTRHNVVNRQG